MRRSVPWSLFAAGVVLGLTACGTTASGAASASASASGTSVTTLESPSGTTDPASTAVTAATTDGTDPVAAELISRVRAGFAATTSLSGTIVIDGGGTNADIPVATFGQLTDTGRVTALQMDLSVPDGSLQMLVVDGRYFVGGAVAQQYGGTWLELAATTSDRDLRDLYTTLDQTVNSASVSQYVGFLALATGTENVGPETLDGGVEAQRYDLTLDLTRLDDAGVDALTRSSLETAVGEGITEIPSSYWIDGTGRLVRIEQQITVGSDSVNTVAVFTDFDAPLDIAAPDPAEVVVAP